MFLLICLFVVLALVYFITLYERESETDELNQEIGRLNSHLLDRTKANVELMKNLQSLQEKFDKLQFQKVSADVKLGQKAENILPFLDSFPYKDDEIKGLFQPVDLIVFRQDEIVFVEVKTGSAGLSEKERRIRDLIKDGKVRFEVHRMNEKGVTVK